MSRITVWRIIVGPGQVQPLPATRLVWVCQRKRCRGARDLDPGKSSYPEIVEHFQGRCPHCEPEDRNPLGL